MIGPLPSPPPETGGGDLSSLTPAFTDAEIAEGFLKTAFGAELHLAGQVNRIRKFDGPVRVHVESPLKNPPWHPSKGQKCWIFVDEITVE